MITETWFNAKTLIVLEGYNHFAKNREATNGGGVVIFVRNDLKAIELQINTKGAEMVWCNILLGTESLIVGCIYRPPHAKREVNMEINNAITKAKTICDKKNHQGLVIGGDFNHLNIIWREDGGSFGKKKGQPSVELVNCITSNELIQLVKNPTFGKNVLDLVITDDPDRIFKIDYGPPIGATKKNSLHGTLTWNYTLRAEKKTGLV